MLRGVSAFPVKLRLVVQWGELDALGHVNHARYLTWMESARIELLRRVGLATVGEVACGPILAHVRCDYLVPVHFPAEVEVGVRVTSLGRTSVGMAYEVTDALGAEGRVHARGESVLVMYDFQRGEKVPVPDALRPLLEGLK